jgi:hypothetical protein
MITCVARPPEAHWSLRSCSLASCTSLSRLPIAQTSSCMATASVSGHEEAHTNSTDVSGQPKEILQLLSETGQDESSLALIGERLASIASDETRRNALANLKGGEAQHIISLIQLVRSLSLPRLHLSNHRTVALTATHT